MKAQFQFPVRKLSGSDGFPGGVVYLGREDIPVIRSMVIPSNPKTAEQNDIRSFFTAASQAFQTLSASQRSNWQRAAVMYTRNILGYTWHMNALTLFMQVNILRQIDGLAITLDLTAQSADFTATNIATVAYNSTTTHLTFTLTHTATTVTNRLWLLRVTPKLLSAQRTPRHSDYRLVKGIDTASIIPVATSPQSVDITAPIITWANNDWMAIEAVPMRDCYIPGFAFSKKQQIAVT